MGGGASKNAVSPDHPNGRAAPESVFSGAADYTDDGSHLALGGRVILVLGGPGSGVAEQCDRLADKYGCLHLGIESLMRTAVANESDAGKKISELIKGGMRAIDTLTSSRLGSHRFMRVRTGKIIPSTLYLSLLKSAITPDSDQVCLVEGFPKSLDSLQLLEQHIGLCQRALLLDASDHQLQERLVSMPTKGSGKTIPVEVAQRRIRTFRNQTLPAVAALDGRGVLTKVDASGTAEATFKGLSDAYQKIM